MRHGELERELHDIAVRQIAEARFVPPALRYTPGEEHPTWKTYINIPSAVMPIKDRDDNALYPDIVIVDTEQGNAPIVACEVESASGVNDEVANRWKACSEGCMKFYLYVPEGYATKAAGLLLKHNVTITRFRTYGFDSLWHVRITAV